MPPKAIRMPLIPEETQAEFEPLLPTIVVGAYKGGVGKTSITVAIAERLAWTGLRVLLLTTDTQEDARARLGVKRTEPAVAHRHYGQGTVTVVGLRGSKAMDVLYRSGPERHGLGSFDVAILDTPPEVHGGKLPGVLLVAPLDGKDAARNLLTLLNYTPRNTDIVLVKMGRTDEEEWKENVEQIEVALGRSVMFLPKPLPRTKRVHEAHNEGRSVWTLRRTGGTVAFLAGMDALAQLMWTRRGENRPWPSLPAASASAPYVLGWDDED